MEKVIHVRIEKREKKLSQPQNNIFLEYIFLQIDRFARIASVFSTQPMSISYESSVLAGVVLSAKFRIKMQLNLDYVYTVFNDNILRSKELVETATPSFTTAPRIR
jgi:hypothetical protein